VQVARRWDCFLWRRLSGVSCSVRRWPGLVHEPVADAGAGTLPDVGRGCPVRLAGLGLFSWRVRAGRGRGSRRRGRAGA